MGAAEEILEIESLLEQMLKVIHSSDDRVPECELMPMRRKVTEGELAAIRRKLAEMLTALRQWDEFEFDIGNIC